jgi:hypothetical protein
MYTEFSLTSRSKWKYTYKGSELAPLAMKVHSEFSKKEMNARRDLAILLGDPNIGHEDKRIRELKSEIENNGVQREQCAVFAHEFQREPDKTYLLSLGDVVFFGLAPLANAPGKSE